MAGRGAGRATAGGRPSMSRRSSVVYGKPGPSRVDPRPVTDKGFQVACMRKLVEYLSTHGYGFPISPKLLPSGKEIFNMIEFLIHQIDPNFRLTKLEDDVPLFFRVCCYPFQISKSALYAAGSPHSWPTLLAALAWLVDLLIGREYATEAKQKEASFDFDASMAESYRLFFLGDDDSCAALEENMQRQYLDEIQEIQENAKQTAQRLMALDAKLQGLKSGPSPLQALETKKSLIMDDIGKFNDYIQKWNAAQSGLQKRVAQHNEQIKSKEAENEALSIENQELLLRVAQQTVSIEDYEKMTRELQQFEEDLQSGIAWRKGKEKETWDLEVLWAKKFKQLEILVHDCNNALKKLIVSSIASFFRVTMHLTGLKLPNVDNSACCEYDVHLNSRGETADELLGIKIKERIRPHLLAMQEETEKNERDKRNGSTELLKQNTILQDEVKEKQARKSQLEVKTKELEEICKKKQEALESFKSEIKTVQTLAEQDEQTIKALELESAERLEIIEKECEQQEAAVLQEAQEVSAKLLSLMEGGTSLMEQIDARCNAVKASVADLTLKVDNNYIRKLKQ